MSDSIVPKSLPLALIFVLGGCADRTQGSEGAMATDTSTETGDGSVTDSNSDSTGTETGSDSDTDDSDTDDSDTDTDSDSDTGEPPPEGFCEDACSVIAQDSCLLPEDCLDQCGAHVEDWNLELGEAFAACAASNPLCFESVEGCMFNELYPVGTPFDLSLTGLDFGNYEGLTLRAWSDQQPALDSEVNIAAGSFALEWSESVPVFDVMGPLVLYFIDVDSDGQCDPDMDRTGSVSLEWNGDLLAPSFDSEVSSAGNDAPFVCDFLP